MNVVILMGRLVRDPDIRYTQGQDQMCVAKFTLAVDRRGKDQGADFIACTAFGKNGEFAEKYLKKGTKIAAEGRWQTGSYTNKEGQKIYTNDCIVDHMEFAESKKAAEAATPAPNGADDFMNIDDECPFGDMPFGDLPT